MAKVQRYERLSKRAGIATSVSLIFWLLSMFGAASLPSSEEHPTDWVGVACGLTFLTTVACGVTCLAAAVLSRYKSKEPDHDNTA